MGQLREATGEPCRPHVLDAFHQVLFDGLEGGLHEELSQKGVPHLDCRPVLLLVLGKLPAGEGGTPNPIPSRLGPGVVDGPA